MKPRKETTGQSFTTTSMNDRIAQKIVSQMQKRVLHDFAPDREIKHRETEEAPETDLSQVEPQVYLSLDPRKTLAMRLLESKYHRDIREALSYDYPADVISRRLGISVGTVSRWRKRLGIGE